MSRQGLIVVGFSLLIAASGCMTATRRAIKEAKGADSDIEPVPGTHTRELGKYRGVEIRPVWSDLGGLVDTRFSDTLNEVLQMKLCRGRRPVFPGGEPILTIEPEVMFYMMHGSMGAVVGSDCYAVVLFFLSDGETLLGKIQVKTVSAAARTGPDDLAIDMGESLADYLREVKKRELRRRERQRNHERDRDGDDDFDEAGDPDESDEPVDPGAPDDREERDDEDDEDDRDD